MFTTHFVAPLPVTFYIDQFLSHSMKSRQHNQRKFKFNLLDNKCNQTLGQTHFINGNDKEDSKLKPNIHYAQRASLHFYINLGKHLTFEYVDLNGDIVCIGWTTFVFTDIRMLGSLYVQIRGGDVALLCYNRNTASR